jgi:hypothetical protein
MTSCIPISPRFWRFTLAAWLQSGQRTWQAMAICARLFQFVLAHQTGENLRFYFVSRVDVAAQIGGLAGDRVGSAVLCLSDVRFVNSNLRKPVTRRARCRIRLISPGIGSCRPCLIANCSLLKRETCSRRRTLWTISLAWPTPVCRSRRA